MFDFSGMAGNYESRKVDKYDEGDLFISTARVTDGSQPYETAVQHPDYNDGKMVIVEAYDTPETAQTGHDRWLALMSKEPLPGKLVDCANAGVTQLGAAIIGDEFTVFPRTITINQTEDDPRPGYDWCQRCGEDTWSLERHQCEKCGFTD